MTDTQSSGELDRAALDALLDMVGGDTAFMKEMVDTFLAEAPGLVAEMDSARATGDAPSLRRAAHSLKSNSRTFGALHLANLCQEIESLAAGGQTAEAGALLPAAAAELEIVAGRLTAEQAGR